MARELWKGHLRIERKSGDAWTIEVPRTLGTLLSSISEREDLIETFTSIEKLPSKELDGYSVIMLRLGARKLN